tara:strand:- start:2405 stop:4444 length:2040 start_codon:yes stop_codon:yes gene_type:complete
MVFRRFTKKKNLFFCRKFGSCNPFRFLTKKTYRSIAEKYYANSKKYYLKFKEEYAKKKGLHEYTDDELELLNEQMRVGTAEEQKQAEQKMQNLVNISSFKQHVNKDMKSIIKFLKSSIENNFIPSYSSWYRNHERDKIIKPTYEIVDARWVNIIKDKKKVSLPAPLETWQKMTGDNKNKITYILEDLQLIAMEYLNRKTYVNKNLLEKTLYDIIDKNRYDLNKLALKFLKFRIKFILKNRTFNRKKSTKYLKKFKKINLELVDNDNLSQISDKRIRKFKQDQFANIYDSYIDVEKRFQSEYGDELDRNVTPRQHLKSPLSLSLSRSKLSRKKSPKRELSEEKTSLDSMIGTPRPSPSEFTEIELTPKRKTMSSVVIPKNWKSHKSKKLSPGELEAIKQVNEIVDDELHQRADTIPYRPLTRWTRRNPGERRRNLVYNEFNERLEILFPDKDGWEILDPPGDGLCSIYSLYVTQDPTWIQNTQNLKCNVDLILNDIADGIQLYYESNPGAGEEIIQIEEHDIFPINKYTQKEVIKTRLKKIFTLGTTPSQLAKYLAYKFDRHILLLTYDDRSREPYGYVPFLNNNPEDIDSYTIILTAFGHTVLIHNPDPIKIRTFFNNFPKRDGHWMAETKYNYLEIQQQQKRLGRGKKSKKRRKSKKRKSKKRKSKKRKSKLSNFFRF